MPCTQLCRARGFKVRQRGHSLSFATALLLCYPDLHSLFFSWTSLTRRESQSVLLKLSCERYGRLHVVNGCQLKEHVLPELNWSITHTHTHQYMLDVANLYVEISNLDREARDHVESSCRWWCDSEHIQSQETHQRLMAAWLQICADMTTSQLASSTPQISNNPTREKLDDSLMLLSTMAGSSSLEEAQKLYHSGMSALATAAVNFDEVISELERAWVQQQMAGSSSSATSSLGATTSSKDHAALLREHILEVELPLRVRDCEDQFHTIQLGLDDERNFAVGRELSRRAQSRQRLQRLAKVEAVRRVLESDIDAAKKCCLELQKRVEADLAASHKRREATFSRFSVWDLSRRELSHTLHQQETFRQWMDRLCNDITNGCCTGPSAAAASFPLDKGGHRNALTPGAREHGGSVEWLERLELRWERLRASAPTFEPAVRDNSDEGNRSSSDIQRPPHFDQPVNNAIQNPLSHQRRDAAAVRQRNGIQTPSSSKAPTDPGCASRGRHPYTPPSTPAHCEHPRQAPHPASQHALPHQQSYSQPHHQGYQSIPKRAITQPPRMTDYIPATRQLPVHDALQHLAARRSDVHNRLFGRD